MQSPLSATLLWFTFAGDSACLLQSVRAARNIAPDCHRLIAMEAARPLPLDLQSHLRGMGCQVETDFCDRANNLNSLAHFKHQLEWMAAAGNPDDAQSWVVKIDSDTILNQHPFTWLSQAGPVHTAVCAWQPTWWFQGPAYGIRAADLPGLGRAVAETPQIIGEMADLDYPEDLTMGHLVAAVHGAASILQLSGGDTSTLFHGEQIAHYDYRRWPAFEVYEAFRVLHFGNRTCLPLGMPDAVKRLTVARVMERYLDWRQLPA